jgi:N6-adenosine-specific RNA methylase IME4
MSKKYDIIYMDPPWQYSSRLQTGSGRQKDLSEEYPTMSNNELKEMDIQSITNKDSLIYMWATNPFMAGAIDIARHWGFDFCTVGFVWDKQMVNPGSYTMGQAELCLVFKKKKGKIPQPRGTRNEKQFLSQKRRQHSRKPDEIRDAIERMHPTQSKLEMFARVSSEGWDVWGNETNKFNINETELF